MLLFKKLNENAVLPKRAHPTDAGLDIVATSVEYNNGYIEYGTGLAVNIPVGCVGLLFPRSSVTNKDLMLKNSVGCIDADYRGEIKARFYRTNGVKSTDYSVGDRIAQLLIVPIQLHDAQFVDELPPTVRNTGGFGSTNK